MGKTHGGQRPGAGRKKGERKTPITIYVDEKDIIRLGGREAVRAALLTYISDNKGKEAIMPEIKKEALKQPPIASQKVPPKNTSPSNISSPNLNQAAILAQIKEIEAEKIPKEKDTYLGRRAWKFDQNQKIQHLKNMLVSNSLSMQIFI